MQTHIDLDFLEDILKDESDHQIENRYPVPPQTGPFRFFDTEMRCASRGCGSPTRYKLQGIPYCSVHVMRKMNEMLIELGVEK